ncbi:MAG: carboxypeptidase regulatory-like domain-containing protein [Fibrobacter sp.]|nr:carboxypeptidase regulatory-like domain-containing protein [Fibrobacter sp.]
MNKTKLIILILIFAINVLYAEKKIAPHYVSISGTVYYELSEGNSTPASGLNVKIGYESSDTFWEIKSVITDKNGYYSLDSIDGKSWSSYTLICSINGYEIKKTTIFNEFMLTDTVIDIVLNPQSLPLPHFQISGTVMYDPFPAEVKPVPLENIKIRIEPIPGVVPFSDGDPEPNLLPTIVLKTDSTFSDSEGKFYFSAFSANYQVLVTGASFRERQFVLNLINDTSITINLVSITSKATLKGKIYSGCHEEQTACSWEPLAGCTVTVFQDDIKVYPITGKYSFGNEPLIAITDEQGKYSIDSIPVTVNGEMVTVTAKKSGLHQTGKIAIWNMTESELDFDLFKSSSDSLVVRPSVPKENDSILFRVFESSHCCCAQYKDKSVSVKNDSIILVYHYDSSMCKECNCAGSGAWVELKSGPLNAGIFSVFKEVYVSCLSGSVCLPLAVEPQLIGSVTIEPFTPVIRNSDDGNRNEMNLLKVKGTSFSVNLKVKSHLSVRTLNLQGVLQEEIVNRSLPAGVHSFCIDKRKYAGKAVIMEVMIDGVLKNVKMITLIK